MWKIIMNRLWFAMFAFMAGVLSSGQSQADIVFSFNYTDAAGQGFNKGGVEGQQRRNALETAASQFATAFSSYSANLVLDVNGSATGDTLMGAGTNYKDGRAAGFGLGEVVRNKVLFGTDLNGATSDGSVAVNFGFTWQLDHNVTVASDQADWYSTAYHEFSHAFGFASGISTTGGIGANDGYQSYDVVNTDGSWAKFDQFITDKDGNSVFAGSNLNETNYESLLVGGKSPEGGLFFNGTEGRYGLYTPTTFKEGSSGAHLDDQNAAYAGMLMLANSDFGPNARLFSSLEQSIFRDLGYMNVGQISAVPEPSTFSLLAVLGGVIGYRRRTN